MNTNLDKKPEIQESGEQKKKHNKFVAWWLGLKKGTRIALSILGAGVIASAVTFPILAATVWNKKDGDPVKPEPVAKKWYEKDNWYELTEEATTDDIGVTSKLTMDSLEYNVRLIGLNHDDVVNDSGEIIGKAKTTWEFSTVICKSNKEAEMIYWNNDITTTNFVNTTLNKKLNDESSQTSIISRLPLEIKNKIKKIKKSVAGNSPWSELKFDTKIFSLSGKELNENVSGDYGTTYNYYNIEDETLLKESRKKSNLNGIKKNYWLRSPDISAPQTRVHYCSASTGGIGFDPCYSSYNAYVPAFCI